MNKFESVVLLGFLCSQAGVSSQLPWFDSAHPINRAGQTELKENSVNEIRNQQTKIKEYEMLNQLPSGLHRILGANPVQNGLQVLDKQQAKIWIANFKDLNNKLGGIDSDGLGYEIEKMEKLLAAGGLLTLQTKIIALWEVLAARTGAEELKSKEEVSEGEYSGESDESYYLGYYSSSE